MSVKQVLDLQEDMSYMINLNKYNTPDSFLNEATSLTAYTIDKISN